MRLEGEGVLYAQCSSLHGLFPTVTLGLTRSPLGEVNRVLSPECERNLVKKEQVMLETAVQEFQTYFVANQ